MPFFSVTLSAAPAQAIPAGCSAISQQITSPTRAASTRWATNVQAQLLTIARRSWTGAADSGFSSRKFYRAADLLGRADKKSGALGMRVDRPLSGADSAAWRIQHSRFTICARAVGL